MGQGEEEKTRPDPKVKIQERGEIFFFYRPKINTEQVHSADDVQRLYIVLRPESAERDTEIKQSSDSGKEGEKKKKKMRTTTRKGHPHQDRMEGGHGCEEVNIEKHPLLRFIVMGRKSLPDPSKRSSPYWGFVEMVTTKVEDIKLTLQGGEYDTSTRGRRHKPPVRALAEGIYRILKHESGKKLHTHLVYKLELPTEDKGNEPQESLNVKREGSFLIQIKNPDQKASSSFRGIQGKRKAVFPASLQGQFGSRRYSAADPPDFLNYEGCEFLLISASDNIEDELGLELKTEECAYEESCSNLIELFVETASPKPLFTGTWE